MKEAMYIKWENPFLNQQLKHLELSLSYSLLFIIHFFQFVCFVFISAFNDFSYVVLKLLCQRKE